MGIVLDQDTKWQSHIGKKKVGLELEKAKTETGELGWNKTMFKYNKWGLSLGSGAC